MLASVSQGHASALAGVKSILADLALPAPPAVPHVPRGARPALQAAWAAVSREVCCAHAAWSATRTADLYAQLCLAWSVILLFGHWLLCASPSSKGQCEAGMSLADHLRQGVDLLCAGDLSALRARTASRVAEAASACSARKSAHPKEASTMARVARSASRLILGGGPHGVTRGVARCESAAPAPALASHADALKLLHPSAPPPSDERVTAFMDRMADVRSFVAQGHVLPLPEGENEEERIIADGVRLVSALAHARGKAAGADAISADILHELLVDCRACQTATMGIIRLIQDGLCPPLINARLAAARLIGLPKPNSTKLRPIAIAPVLRRVAASLLVRHYKAAVESAVGPRQFGFSTAGREAVHLALSATLHEHPDWTLLELDIQNAFNEALRDAMLVECRERLPQLLPMARAFYLQPSDLLFRCSDNTLIKLLSARGSQQGDPLGGVLFDLVLRPILDELVVQFPALVNVAFQDNMYLVGPVSLLAAATAWLKARLQRVCLELKPSGFNVWSPTALDGAHRQTLIDLDIPAGKLHEPVGGFVVLGTPFGDPEYVSWTACTLVDAALAILESPTFDSLEAQAQWLGLFFSVSRRVGHLARFVPPELLVPAEARARHRLHAYARAFFRIAAPLSEVAKVLLEIPLRQGGMGLRLFAREPAFLAGMLTARSVLRARFNLPAFTVPPTSSSITLQRVVANAFLPHQRLGVALAAAHLSLAEMERTVAEDVAHRPPLPGRMKGDKAWETLLDPSKPPPCLQELVPHFDVEPCKGLQGHLTSILHGDALVQWRQMAGVEEDARRVSQSGPCGAAWLLAFPGGPSAPEFRRSLRWIGSTFLTALQLRLGVPLTVLFAAGVPSEGTPCWVRRFRIDADSTGAVDASAAPATDPDAAVAPLEEGAREGDSTPSPHVQGAGTPAGSMAVGGPISTTPPLQPLRRTAAASTTDRLIPHRVDCCGPHPRRTVLLNGRALLQCPNQAHHIMQHDAVAQTLASESPSLPQSGYPCSERYASAAHHVVSSRLLSRAPGGHWKVPDVAVPPDTFLDVAIAQWHAVSASRLRADGRSSVLYALCMEEDGKIQHYRHEQAPGGPLNCSRHWQICSFCRVLGRIVGPPCPLVPEKPCPRPLWPPRTS